MNLQGHYWTLAGYLDRRMKPPHAPESTPWELQVDDPQVGPVKLTGRLARPQGAETLLLLVHGVGGCSESSYIVAMAERAVRSGLAVLRVNLRGSDRRGEDLYHGGLTADLHSIVAAPDLARYERVVAVGYSLGGHLALRWGTEEVDPRLLAVVAICPPLDLLNCATAIDRPSRWIYRRHILQQLKEIYAEVAARRAVPTALREVLAVHSMVRFDDLTVARRHGFSDARDYYSQMSVGPRLHQLRIPALVVEAERDPMVPRRGLLPFLDPLPTRVDLRWLDRGGHIGFPAGLDLDESASFGLENQVLAWLQKRLDMGRC